LAVNREQVALPEPRASGVVLAGGESSRLGRDKALLELGGDTLLARAVHALRPLSDDIIIVANDPHKYEPLGLPARLVSDAFPGRGSLVGIYSGLSQAVHPYALIVACDMPFLNVSLLRYMLGLMEGYDVVIPQLDGFLEPLHAVYRRSCLPAMHSLLDRGRRQIIGFFPEVRVRYVEQHEIDRFDPRHLSFVNINSAEDWARVQQLLGGKETPPHHGPEG
jgi:molybdopterin-guanine dinucleotide biosynthesis protein A